MFSSEFCFPMLLDFGLSLLTETNFTLKEATVGFCLTLHFYSTNHHTETMLYYCQCMRQQDSE